MGSVLELISSLLSYVAFTGAGGLAGYFFVPSAPSTRWATGAG